MEIQTLVDTFSLSADFLGQFDLVSFDIFDTILLRKVEKPVDAFKLLNLRFDDFRFDKNRVEAEERARWIRFASFGDHEVNLEEIYFELGQPDLLEAEIDLEKKLLTSNVDIVSLIKRIANSGIKIAYTSDTYFTREELMDFFDMLKIPNPDYWFISSERRKSKATLDLYLELLELTKLNPEKILHIGDNFISDYTNPKSLNIASLHYPAIRDREKKTTYFDDKKDPYASVFSALIDIRIHSQSMTQIDQDQRFWHEFGYAVGGPLLIGYLSWLQKSIEIDKIDKLLFISRDGYLPYTVFEKFFHSIPSEYVLGSRLSLSWVNSLGSFMPFVEGVLRQRGVSIQVALQNFQLNDIPVLFSCFTPVELSLMIGEPSADQILKTRLIENERIIREHAAKNYKVYLEYLKTTTKNVRNVGFVDIGWHGTQQAMLSAIVSKPLFGYVLGIWPWSRYLQDSQAYLFHGNSDLGNRRVVSECVELFELIFSAPHPTFMNMSKRDGLQIPIYAEQSDFELRRLNIWNHLSEGVLRFVEDFMEIYNFIDNSNFSISCHTAIMPIKRVLFQPTRDELDFIGQVEHSPNPGESVTMTLIPKNSVHLSQLKMAPFWPTGYRRYLQKFEAKNLLVSRILLYKTYLILARTLGLKVTLQVLRRKFLRHKP